LSVCPWDSSRYARKTRRTRATASRIRSSHRSPSTRCRSVSDDAAPLAMSPSGRTGFARASVGAADPDRVGSRAGMRRIVDRAADFVLAVERVFGVHPRLLDGSRAVQIGDVRLSLEAGERELCVIRMHGALEEYLAIFEVRGDIEVPLLQAKELLRG